MGKVLPRTLRDVFFGLLDNMAGLGAFSLHKFKLFIFKLKLCCHINHYRDKNITNIPTLSAPEWYFGIIYSSICQQTSILIKNTIWFLKKLGEEGEIQVNIIPHQVQGQKMPARSSPVVENTPSPRFPSYPTIFLPCYFPLLHPRGDICLQTDLFYATKARSTQNRGYISPKQARFIKYLIWW